MKVAYPGYGDIWVQDPDKVNGKWVHRGYSEEWPLCFRCYLQLKPWIQGKDKRLAGQEMLV